ncbi:MAG: VWA domain-containing protein [Vicinamibacterales bacterium]
MRRLVAVLIVVVAATGVLSRAQSAPTLRFTSPTAGTYLTGAVTLRVDLEGASIGVLEDVTFFADGRQICVAPGNRPQCEWDAGANLKEHVLRAVGRLKVGGRLIANVRTSAVQYAESSVVNIVQANVFVTEGGRFVKGLTREAFRLLDDRQPRQVTGFSPAGSPIEVVLALDVSGSMADALGDVKVAAKTFLAALGPQDQVTVVAFNDSMFTLVRRETSREAREAAIDGLSAFGGTALYDVIVRALEQLGQQPGRRALVLLSDGEDRSSQATFAQVQDLVRRSDATLFAVGLGRGASVQELKEKLEALAETSGGRVLFAERSDGLKVPFAEVVEDLASQYTLSFAPNADGKEHELRVELPGRNARIRARKSYTVANAGVPAAR